MRRDIESSAHDAQEVADVMNAHGTVSARDDDLQREVRRALDEHGFRGVGLEVRNGVARLTGHVPTGAGSLQAAVEARSIPGVRAVEDDLRVRAAEH
jgi:osmotically-inducible protein OsmY